MILQPFFKLADRMRSMRTNGASKNRDYCDLNGYIFLMGKFSILYGMYMYTYGMYTVCRPTVPTA